MLRSSRLKVYRSSVGFHDAYVAAPSKKAALEAWGASRDLFAIGSAEIVTDPKLTAEPLASPGRVIKRSRGGLAEQLAALPERKARPRPRERAQPAPEAAPKPKAKPKPKPPPRRDKLDAAEAALATFEAQARRKSSELSEREEALRRERAALERAREREVAKLERTVEQAKRRYEAALEKWRND